MLVWVSYLEALSIVCFKRSWQFCLPPTCHSWKRAWRSCCSWKIFTTKKNSASSTYFRITNIFRYSTDEWKRSWNFIKTSQYFLSYHVTKTTVYSLLKPGCVRETPWCKVYWCLWKWNAFKNFIFGISEYFFEENIKRK